MTLKKPTILVTGGTGYIGSHTVVQLLEAGNSVVILDNLCNSKREVVHRIKQITGQQPDLVIGDIRDRATLRSLSANRAIDAVIHFAGLKAVGESVAEPLKYYDNNVTGSVVLFEEMARAGVKTLASRRPPRFTAVQASFSTPKIYRSNPLTSTAAPS